MKLNKFLNLGLVMVPATLAVGVATVAITVGVILSSSSTASFSYPYNKLVTDYSQSTDANDKKVLEYYQNNTISLRYTFSGGTSFGTAWFWSEDANFSYFATNLHVINNVLEYNATSALPYAERFSLDTTTVFKYATHDIHDTLKYKDLPVLSAVKLKKIYVRDGITNLETNGKSLYSDLVILQTTTRLPHQQSQDFIDTDDELTYALNDVTNKTYYISGFPYNTTKNTTEWRTGKYKWQNNEKYKSDGIGWSTAWRMFGENNYIFNNTLGLKIRGNSVKPHLSYARQLILPGLNFSGGSSGSLVSVWNDNTKKLQPLGIYWGTYVNGDSSDETTHTYYGGVDLFYSGNFKLYNNSIDYSYDNSKI